MGRTPTWSRRLRAWTGACLSKAPLNGSKDVLVATSEAAHKKKSYGKSCYPIHMLNLVAY
jgi:hypothetical protein